MIKTQLYTQEWINLPQEIRNSLATIFGLSKDCGTEVVDNRIVSDGFSNESLKGITIEKMQHMLKTEEEDFMKLFSLVLESLTGSSAQPEPTVEVGPEIISTGTFDVESIEQVEEVVDTKPKKKNAKNA